MSIREVNAVAITDAVEELCIRANTQLPPDVKQVLDNATAPTTAARASRDDDVRTSSRDDVRTLRSFVVVRNETNDVRTSSTYDDDVASSSVFVRTSVGTGYGR